MSLGNGNHPRELVVSSSINYTSSNMCDVRETGAKCVDGRVPLEFHVNRLGLSQALYFSVEQCLSHTRAFVA